MDAGPDEAAIGVDIHFGDAEFCCWKVFVFIYTAGRGIEGAAGSVDAADFFLGDAG